MFNIVRKIVAGPKNRTVDNQFDLDLTYITDQIIAMAFPASGIQKTYRNSINDVSRFLNLNHGTKHYLIINASNRKYNYEPFNNQVMQFFWTDHQAPPITTMFEMCEQMMKFLSGNWLFMQESGKNVVAVHCNHGKGRTGTAIIAYLLFSGQFTDVKSALTFYNTKRFRDEKLAVDQPCQLRYINYFKSFLELPLTYLSQPLKAYRLTRVEQKGLKDKEMFIRISQTRTEHVIYPEVSLSEEKVTYSRPLIGDVFIELYQHSWSRSKQLLRINYNLFFLSRDVDRNVYQVRFMGEEIKMRHQNDGFQLVLEFEEFCHCHKTIKQECLCYKKRQREMTYWQKMVGIIVWNKQRGLKEEDKNKGEKQIVQNKEEKQVKLVEQNQNQLKNQDNLQQQ